MTTDVLEKPETTEDTSLAKIKHLIANPPTNSRIIEISPMVALELLKMNNGNRPKKTGKIREYREDMLKGDWKLTGDTIKFSDKGLLRDGQNRLYACVEAGVSFTTHVVFGVNDEDFWWMDRGKTRNSADGFAVVGEEEPRVLTGALRWIKLYETQNVKARTIFLPAETDAYWRSGKVDQELVKEAVKVSAECEDYDVTRTPRNHIAALYYIFMKADEELAKAFFAVYRDDKTEDESFRPILTAKETIRRMMKTNAGRVHEVVRLAIYVQAWNAILTGKDRKIFKFNPKTQDFPMVLSPEPI